jgi:ribose transport system ATP-binding protein
MVGREVDDLYPRSPHASGEVVLEINHLAGVKKPSDASLKLRRGQVLGVAGIVGAGRTEMLRAIFGLDPVRSGSVRVNVFTGPASPVRRWAQGVGLLSEDRKTEGLALALSIGNNLTLSKLTGMGPAGLVMPGQQNKIAGDWIKKMRVKCSGPTQAIGALSGGNQQKVAIARLLHHDVDVLLLDEPTRGIDVGSKAQIYQLIDELALSGKAILIVSSYLPELMGVCDRIAVMCRGVLGPARPVAQVTEHQIMIEATGSEKAA